MQDIVRKSGSVSAVRKKAMLAICLVGASLLLSGCLRPDEDHMEFFYISHEDRHPIHIKENMQELALQTNTRDGLSDREKRRLKKFFYKYRQQGSEGIQVYIPRASEDKVSVVRAVETVKDLANSAGITRGYLDIRSFRTSYDDTLLRLKYSYATASTPKCGDYSQNLSVNDSNLHYHNYGCATQKNIAAMLANPRDLKGPRGVESRGRSSERRDVIWDKYVKGETTVSQRSSDEKGTVSEVAKQ